MNHITQNVSQESIENEVAVVDADSSPVVVANEADLRLRQIFPVFESGMGRSSTGNQPITFLRPDQVNLFEIHERRVLF